MDEVESSIVGLCEPTGAVDGTIGSGDWFIMFGLH